MSSSFYRVSKYLAVLLTLVHVLCLSYIASYDGMEYVHLANLIGTPSFTQSWNYLRTPLFPASLKAAFLLGGEQPMAAMLVTAGFGLAGVLLIGSVVSRIAGYAAGGVTLILLTIYPTLVTYEHMLLSETGIFFFWRFSFGCWSGLNPQRGRFWWRSPWRAHWLSASTGVRQFCISHQWSRLCLCSQGLPATIRFILCGTC